MKRPPKTDLKQIAIDLRAGRIFCDRYISDPKMLSSIFMIFAFMKNEQIDKLKANPPGLIYEYYSEAGPMSVNGMPTFFSCRMLSKTDTKKVLKIVKKLEEAEKTVRP